MLPCKSDREWPACRQEAPDFLKQLAAHHAAFSATLQHECMSGSSIIDCMDGAVRYVTRPSKQRNPNVKLALWNPSLRMRRCYGLVLVAQFVTSQGG